MKARKYALYEKIDGRWHRLSTTAYTKPVAVRVFQSRLIEMSCSGRIPALRPVSDTERIAVPEALMKQTPPSAEQDYDRYAGGAINPRRTYKPMTADEQRQEAEMERMMLHGAD